MYSSMLEGHLGEGSRTLLSLGSSDEPTGVNKNAPLHPGKVGEGLVTNSTPGLRQSLPAHIIMQ
jgi:hypothetical protein